MTSNDPRAPRAGRTGCGCNIDIRISSRGDVHIHNCADGGHAPRPPADKPCKPPRAEGACVPLGLGCKPKQSRRRKLERLKARNPVPSVLAASFFQTARRFLAGAAPVNDFERDVYPVFSGMSAEVRDVMACAVDSFETVPPDLRNAGLDPDVTADPDRPVDTTTLTAAIVREIGQRGAHAVFGDANALEEERPGRNRFFPPDGEIPPIQFRICAVNGLRTANFAPPLAIGDYLPAEIQQHCELVLQPDGTIQQNCSVVAPPCPGNILPNDTCARVPDVAAGDTVVVTGVNFINVDIRARLTARVGTASAEVDAHVVGDLDTPLDEQLGGETRPIRDCRVHDRLSFAVPDTLPPGVYELVLLMPNTTGFPAFGPTVFSNAEYVNVLPPATARFQVVAERLRAREETSPASFGSDEVAFTVLAAALLPDGTTGPIQRLDRRFDDVDSGDNRTIEGVIFANAQEIVGAAMSLIGFEVDSERAFNRQIRDFSSAFVDYITRAWDKFRAELGAGAGAAIKALGLVKGAIAIAVAAVVAAAVIAIVAYWAPADLIMDDAIGYSVVELAELTDAGAPSPGFEHFDSPQGLRINTNPLGKTALTYREFREYVADDEDSRYEVYFRYNRTA